MKKIIFCLLFLTSVTLGIAQKFSSVKSNIRFYSDAPLEKIEAVNTDSKSVLNSSNNEIAFVVPIKNFHFESPLMEEHFNENYMESNKFKFGTFKGKINEKVDFSKDGKYEVTATGILNIHGVEKERTISGTLIVAGTNISADSKFSVQLKEHNIDIPKLVLQNIAEVVEVFVHFEYEPKKD
jgi:hypothetical protein